MKTYILGTISILCIAVALAQLNVWVGLSFVGLVCGIAAIESTQTRR